MPYHIKSSDLSSMSEQERRAALDRLTEAATADSASGRRVLDARIRQYELRYEISSDTLREKLREGQVRETAEIAKWLFLLDARESYVAR